MSKFKLTESESGSAVAVAEAPRAPVIGDHVHLYRTAWTAVGSGGEPYPTSFPAKVVRVRTPGRHDTAVDIVSEYEVVLKCRPIAREQLAFYRKSDRKLINRWFHLAPDGDMVRETPTVAPEIGTTVGLYSLGVDGFVYPKTGQVTEDAGYGFCNIVIIETFQHNNVTFGGDHPGDREWGWVQAADFNI